MKSFRYRMNMHETLVWIRVHAADRLRWSTSRWAGSVRQRRCRVFLAVPPTDARRAPDPAGVGVLLNEITRLRFDLDDRGRPWCVVPREDVATVLRVGRRFSVIDAT